MVFNHLMGVRFPLGPPYSIMKLLRVGKNNQEKPAIIDDEGNLKDLSSIIKDLNPDTINNDTFKKIEEANLQNLQIGRAHV